MAGAPVVNRRVPAYVVLGYMRYGLQRTQRLDGSWGIIGLVATDGDLLPDGDIANQVQQSFLLRDDGSQRTTGGDDRLSIGGGSIGEAQTPFSMKIYFGVCDQRHRHQGLRVLVVKTLRGGQYFNQCTSTVKYSSDRSTP